MRSRVRWICKKIGSDIQAWRQQESAVGNVSFRNWASVPLELRQAIQRGHAIIYLQRIDNRSNMSFDGARRDS